MLIQSVSDALPQQSAFLRGYVDYAAATSDAPEVYHVGVGLTILAGAIAKRLACPYMAGGMLVPNLYTLLVGTSRSGRKTSSVDTGIKLLMRAAPEAVIPIPGSYEEMISQIRQTPSGLLTYREFGHFLKTTQRGYGEQIRTALMDLFDHPTDRPYTRNLRKGKTVIDPPICLSLLSTCSTDLLFGNSDIEEWQGGFFGRMIMLYGDREVFRMPNVWDAARDHLTAVLHQLIHMPMGRCAGFSQYAWIEFERWSRYRDSTAQQFPERVQTFVSGSGTLAAKVALLYSADMGEAAYDGWSISLEAMRRAILFCENLYLPSIKHLGDTLALGIWEKDRQKILTIIESKGNAGVAQKDILRRAKVSLSMFEEVINTLKAEGTVAQVNGVKDTVYKRVFEGGARPNLTVVPMNPTGTTTP
jgi:hypothetical protein